MSRFKTFQTNFNNGQVDANVFGRTEAAQYATAAAEMTNCFCMPQGGARKRTGFKHVDLVVSTGANTVVRTELFDFGTPGLINQSYIIVFYAGVIKIYDAVNRDLEGILSTEYTQEEIYEIDFAQSNDVMLLVHPNHKPKNLQRVGDNSWLLDDIAFTKIPQHSFSIFADPQYLQDQQSINFSDFSNGDTFVLDYNGNLTPSLAYSVSNTDEDTEDATDMAATVQSQLQAITGSANVTCQPIYFTFQDDVFNNKLDEPYEKTITLFSHLQIDFINDLVAQNISIVSTTPSVSITYSGGGGVSNPPEEDVWSITRGWPSTVTFFENRLWFGGSLSRPSTVWASRTGLFFDFSVEGTEPVADDYLDYTMDTDQINKITALYADRNLLIFTNGAEFYVDASPVTPETMSIKGTSRVGAARTKPVNYDNTTMYITNQGSTIRDFVFDFATDGYISNSMTKLASGIMKNPRQIVVQRNNEADESDYMYVRNDDGTAAVFSGDRNNGVAAWSKLEFSGTLASLTVTRGGIVWGVFNREVGGVIGTYIEVQENGLFLDSSSTQEATADGSVINLHHLKDEVITAITEDGIVLGKDFTVSSDGGINFGIGNAGKLITIGLPYEFKVKTLPIALEGNQGNVKFDRKRIVRAFVEVLDTIGINIVYNERARKIKGRQAGLVLGSGPPLVNGVQEVFLNGYSRTTQIALTQNEPYGATVLSLGLELEV